MPHFSKFFRPVAAGCTWLLRANLILALTCTGAAASAESTASPSKTEVLSAMKRATEFVVEHLSCEGGYVWSYLPDLSRRWGEMEALPSMIWTQGQSTPAMGKLFLDAYRATGDRFYYEAAARAADALIWGQHPSGGWNYAIDFAGEHSLQGWYATTGRNAWRLEEFQHYYGNATFDDSVTVDCAKFLLSMFLEKSEPRFGAALHRAIQFVLDAQYPNGGWPQRFPLMGGFTKDGKPDYSSFITFNDGVADENIDFLLLCYTTFGDERLIEPIYRGMDAYRLAQQPAPQPGWALQYTPEMQPAGARSYEPEGLASNGTAACVSKLIDFYYLTGDRSFLQRIPEALDWLESIRLKDRQPPPGRSGVLLPTFVELGTNRVLYLHRSGSNATNGRYYTSDDPTHVIRHYGSVRAIDIERLRARYEVAVAMAPEEATLGSPLPPLGATPRSDTPEADLTIPETGNKTPAVPQVLPGRIHANAPADAEVHRVLASLDAEGRWIRLLTMTSNPYCGDGPAEPTPGDFRSTAVGDKYDTSPFHPIEPIEGITTGTYIQQMTTLIRYLTH